MIVGILGKPGKGKTLLMTFLAWLTKEYGRWICEKLLFKDTISRTNNNDIFANYKLKFDFTPVITFEDMENMRSGSAFMDEFWLWCDSRLSSSSKTRAVSSLALISRKRGLHIYYTSQTWGKIDPRVRMITDLLLVPDFNKRTNVVKVLIMDTSEKNAIILNEFSFNAKPFFNLYDTTEEIGSLYETDNKGNKTWKTPVKDNFSNQVWKGSHKKS